MNFRKIGGRPERKHLLAVCAVLALVLMLLFYRIMPAFLKPVAAERETFAMGTLVRVSVYGRAEAQLAEAADAVMAEISRLEELFSVNIASSDISRINRDPAKPGGHSVSRETYELLELALREAEATAGAFDPTIGALVRFWGIGTENARFPTGEEEGEIRNMLAAVGWNRVRLWKTPAEHDPGQTLYWVSAGEGQALDLGAIAKGYAADIAAAILRERGIKSALIDVGGNLVAIGKSPQRRDWRLGFQHPLRPRGNYYASVAISDATIVTSGAYERFIEKDGVRYHHILDPKTGRSASSDLESVSIVMEYKNSARSSARSDALSTALFVMGFDRAVSFLEAHSDVQAVLVARKKKALSVYVTENLKKRASVREDAFAEAGSAGK